MMAGEGHVNNITMTIGERMHKQHDSDNRGKDRQAYPNGNKEKDLDRLAVGFEGYHYRSDMIGPGA